MENLLYATYIERKGRNPNFSLRSFARQLKISPAQLSQVISGKRPLTSKVALKIADGLNLSPLERNDLISQVHPNASLKAGHATTQISEDEFRMIADWQHFAILSLGELKDNRSDVRWIARRLNIDVMTARNSLERLKRLKLIEERGGRFRQISGPLRTTTHTPSEAIRRNHKQNLEIASRKIDEVSIERREYTSLTLATDPERLEKAKLLINRFKEELGQLLEAGEKTEVYTLAIQLFPLTENRKEKK